MGAVIAALAVIPVVGIIYGVVDPDNITTVLAYRAIAAITILAHEVSVWVVVRLPVLQTVPAVVADSRIVELRVYVVT